MIFVTVGTHPGQFDRLIKRIDEIAPKIKEKIVVQRGFTKYDPKNVESFTFKEDIDYYFKKARVVIVQAATSLLEAGIKYDKPLIAVPRRKKYGEHINDHQVEFAEYISHKTGIKMIMNMDQLTPELLKSYNKKIKIDNEGLRKIQNYLLKIIDEND